MEIEKEVSIDEMDLGEQQTEAKTTKIFSKDFVLSKERTGQIIDKNLLLGMKRKFKIGEIAETYNFERPRKQIYLISETIEGWVDLSKTNLNFLVDTFGEKVSDIIGKQILVEGFPFKKEGLSEGITLKFYI